MRKPIICNPRNGEPKELNPTFSIRSVQSPEELEECIQVRIAVFVEEQQVPIEEEVDDHDPVAYHLLAVDGAGRAVGTARLVDCGGGVGRIGRVCVQPEARNQGVARELVRRLIEAASTRHTELALDAQLYVIPFYASFGFVAEGPVFLDCGLEHQRMTMKLPGIS